MKIDQKWESLGKLDIAGRLSISDTSYFYDEPIIVPVGNGTYEVSVQYGIENGSSYVELVRVAAIGKQCSRSEAIGSLIIDFGQLGICDRDAVEHAFDALGDERMPEYFDQLNTSEPVGWISLPSGERMFIARPGFGDGAYPVYKLMTSDGIAAGIEVECVS
jgi:hypothetical protein